MPNHLHYGDNLHILRDDIDDESTQKTIDKMLLDGCLASPDLTLGRVVTNWGTRLKRDTP
jgi:hypothetical protein